jgi:hypothetical protein
MDATLRNLSYRAQWLHARLERAEATPLALDDDAFYAKLAEAQVG